MKSNREKNKEHLRREQERVRPKEPVYEFKALEDVVRRWVTGR